MGNAFTRRRRSGHFYDVIGEPLNAPSLKIAPTDLPQGQQRPLREALLRRDSSVCSERSL